MQKMEIENIDEENDESIFRKKAMMSPASIKECNNL
jgi:hypothetical protein